MEQKESRLVIGDPVSPIALMFTPVEKTIAKLHEKYTVLSISGIDDKAGFDLVHGARMEIKGYRIDIEKTRKALKADALEYGRRIDGEAKRLILLLAPIETHLENEEFKVQREKEAIRLAKEAERKRELDERMAEIQKLGSGIVVNVSLVEAMTDEEFRAQISTIQKLVKEREQKKAEAETERINKEIEERTARAEEEERLKIERQKFREEQEAAAKKKQEEEEKLAAEKKKVADAQRVVDNELARIQAEENAKRVIESRDRFEKLEAKEKEQKEKEAKELEERSQSDVEKCLHFSMLVGRLDLPDVSEPMNTKIVQVMMRAEHSLRQIAMGCKWQKKGQGNQS